MGPESDAALGAAESVQVSRVENLMIFSISWETQQESKIDDSIDNNNEYCPNASMCVL